MTKNKAMAFIHTQRNNTQETTHTHSPLVISLHVAKQQVVLETEHERASQRGDISPESQLISD